MPAQKLSFLVCPCCKELITQESDGAECGSCGKIYPVQDGVVDLAPAQEYVYSVKSLSFERFQQLIEEARTLGFKAAYRKYLWEDRVRRRARPKRSRLRRFLRDTMLALNGRIIPSNVRTVFYESPASLWLLGSINKSSRVLDLGAGWSAIAHVVARECGHLVAADPTIERLKLSALRAMEDGTTNMTFVRTPTSQALPFADGSFDFVMINGVLEWIPESVSGADPTAVQVQMLREVRRILRPEGQVLVAIENRYALADLLGFPEGHMGLPWVGVLPRPLGNLYHKLVKKRPMRVTTHSLRGLERLYEEAGFPPANTRVFVPQPTYAWFDLIGGGNSRACSIVEKTTISDHTALRRTPKSLRWLMHPVANSVSAFAIVGGEKPWISTLEQIIEHVNQSGLALDLPLRKLRVRESKIMMEGVLRSGQRVHLAVGMSPAGNRRVQNEALHLRTLSGKAGDDLRVPRLLWEGAYEHHSVAVSSHLSGRSLLQHSRANGQWEQSARTLKLLSPLLWREDITVGDLWRKRWEVFRACTTNSETVELADALARRLEPACLNDFAWRGHGDLHPANILIDETGAIGVIDWECAGPQHRDEDAIALALGNIRARYGGIGEAMETVARDPDSHVTEFSRLCPAIGTGRDIVPLLVMVWLKRLENVQGTAVANDPNWMERRVFGVLEKLAAAVT